MSDPRYPVADACVGQIVTPGALLSEPCDRQAHQLGSDLSKGWAGEAELVGGGHREVVEDDVGFCRQRQYELPTGLGLAIDTHAPFPNVRGGEERRGLVIAVSRFDPPEEPPWVGVDRALNLDDFRPKQRQVASDDGARPPAGNLEGAQASERARARSLHIRAYSPPTA